MNENVNMLEDLCVVDASQEGYEALLADSSFQSRGWRQFTSGEQALRSGDFLLTALWLVNLRLPDMEGTSFLRLARRRCRRSPVFLVGERYSAVDEVAARVAGAAAYLWKPADEHWLKLCSHAVSRAAMRKGMQPTLG